jgi:hypothetical protein
MESITNASPHVFRPKFMGRMVGAGHLLMMASGFDLFYVLAKLYVRGDAAVTAANIKKNAGMSMPPRACRTTVGRRRNDLPRLERQPRDAGSWLPRASVGIASPSAFC